MDLFLLTFRMSPGQRQGALVSKERPRCFTWRGINNTPQAALPRIFLACSLEKNVVPALHPCILITVTPGMQTSLPPRLELCFFQKEFQSPHLKDQVSLRNRTLETCFISPPLLELKETLMSPVRPLFFFFPFSICCVSNPRILEPHSGVGGDALRKPAQRGWPPKSSRNTPKQPVTFFLLWPLLVILSGVTPRSARTLAIPRASTPQLGATLVSQRR